MLPGAQSASRSEWQPERWIVYRAEPELWGAARARVGVPTAPGTGEAAESVQRLEVVGAGRTDHLHAALVHPIGAHAELNEALVTGRGAIRCPAEYEDE